MLVKMLPLKYLGNLSMEYDCVQLLEHMNHMLPYEERCKLTWKMCKLLLGKQKWIQKKHVYDVVVKVTEVTTLWNANK